MTTATAAPAGARLRALAALLGASVLATACSPGSIGQAERAANAAAISTDKLIDQSHEPLPPAMPGRFSISDDAYLPADAERSMHGLPIPGARDHVSIFETAPETLPEIARILTRKVGIPVVIAADLKPAQQQQAAPAVSSANVTQALSRLQVADVYGSANSANVNESGQITPTANPANAMTLVFTGHYSDLLDQISAHFGGTYYYDGESIVLSRNVTRTYTLHALAANLNLNTTLTGSGINQSSSGGGGTSSGATSNATQTVSSTIAIKVWDDITNGIASIVADNGKIASILSTGTITVTAPPNIVDAVQNYIDQQNRSLENEITVTVQVLTVQLTNSDNNSLSFTALVKSHGLSALLGNQAPATTSTATTSTGTITPGINIVTGGTNVALSLVSQLGRVSTKNQASVTTMNGFVAPFQFTNTRNYVASTSVTTTPGGGTNGAALVATTLTPGSVTTGFNISVLPRVDFKDRTVLLNYGVSISALAGANNGFDTFTSPDGTASVQLANVNEQDFVNNAEVPDGETIVVTGYSNDQDTVTKTGAGTAGFYGLSGSQAGTKARNMTVILITPTVIKVNHSPIDTSAY